MDSKKKWIVAALGVAVLGIGAFQFAGGGSDEPAPKKEEPVKKQDPPKLAGLTPMPPLEARDPFKPGKLPGAIEEQKPQQPEKTTPPPTSEIGGKGFEPMQLPSLGDPSQGAGQGEMHVEPTFKYTLVGVVMGEVPAAVFADPNGNQKLVTLGTDIDGESKLVAVERGKVIVKFQKQTLTLSIGGTASAKF
jgi:hypothetical protein